MTGCLEYERLSLEVQNLLAELAELTTAQREAFRNIDYEAFHRLDDQLEHIVGVKERAIGSLRQHMKDHKCQPSDRPPFYAAT